uniref:Uncharacterized protein n=1 Tax=Sheathia arcuata TaxID=340433 RepID=A0A3G1I986_9FLOR|nr:hypothetical protein [Sheathia arcuata]ART65501.1 hypothetical protein [Sheathia arcuata]
MNLFELSSFQQYLYNPRCWLHEITSNIKFSIILLYLLLLFYSSVNLLILINCYLIIIPFTLSISREFIYRFYSQLLISYFVVFVILIGIDNGHDSNIIKNDCTLLSANFYFKYLINKNTLLCIKNYQIVIKIHILVSLYIIRLLLISVFSFTLYKLLLLTTYSKDILSYYGRYIVYSFSTTWNNILFVLILSSEWIYFFERKIKNFFITYQLRSMKFIFLYDYIIILKIFGIGINTVIQLISIDTKCIIHSMYAREIFSEKQTIWIVNK